MVNAIEAFVKQLNFTNGGVCYSDKASFLLEHHEEAELCWIKRYRTTDRHSLSMSGDVR